MEIYINNNQDEIDVRLLEGIVKEVIRTGLDLVGTAGKIEISITFVDDGEIQKLNKKYRRIDQPTDVLSFALEEGFTFNQTPELPRILGDIIISLPRAQAQSIRYNHSLERETGYLTAHGLLHLLGYDHKNDQQQQHMRVLEEKIMEKVELQREREEKK